MTVMTFDRLVESTFDKEGRRYAEPPEIDQPTAAGGITLGTLREYVAVTGVPLEVSVATLKSLTVAKARPIVHWKLERLMKAHSIDAIPYEPLRLQALDFAFNSGPNLAIRWLQRVLRVRRTGRIDNATLVAIGDYDPWLVNQALIAARLQMIDMWTDSDARRKAWEEGLENRALSFSLLEVP